MLVLQLILHSTAFLDLSYNTLNGTIPTEVGLMKNLGKTYCRLLLLPICPDMYVCSCVSCILILNSTGELYLDNNNLTGTIPTEIGLMTNLCESCCRFLLLPICPGMYVCSCLSCILILHSTGYLDLYNNNLTGTIATEIGLMTNLCESCCRFLLSPICPGMYVCSCLSCILILNSTDSLYLYNNNFTGNFTCPDLISDCAIACDDSSNESCRSLWWDYQTIISSQCAYTQLYWNACEQVISLQAYILLYIF